MTCEMKESSLTKRHVPTSDLFPGFLTSSPTETIRMYMRCFEPSSGAPLQQRVLTNGQHRTSISSANRGQAPMATMWDTRKMVASRLLLGGLHRGSRMAVLGGDAWTMCLVVRVQISWGAKENSSENLVDS